MTIQIGLGMFVVALVFAFLLGVALVTVITVALWRKSAELLATEQGFSSFVTSFAHARNQRVEGGEHVHMLRCPCNGKGWI
jgi:hypothetical protein